MQLGLSGNPSQHHGGKNLGVHFMALLFPSILRKQQLRQECMVVQPTSLGSCVSHDQVEGAGAVTMALRSTAPGGKDEHSVRGGYGSCSGCDEMSRGQLALRYGSSVKCIS